MLSILSLHNHLFLPATDDYLYLIISQSPFCDHEDIVLFPLKLLYQFDLENAFFFISTKFQGWNLKRIIKAILIVRPSVVTNVFVEELELEEAMREWHSRHCRKYNMKYSCCQGRWPTKIFHVDLKSNIQSFSTLGDNLLIHWPKKLQPCSFSCPAPALLILLPCSSPAPFLLLILLLPTLVWQPSSSSSPYDFFRHGESRLLW